jgi:hypothetical protein
LAGSVSTAQQVAHDAHLRAERLRHPPRVAETRVRAEHAADRRIARRLQHRELKQVREHMHLENNVLFPRAMALESALAG